MANPFNSPSLSGFNDSPPADDGSQVASNEIEWQKHLDKIGTPLKNYVDALKSNTSAAFGKIAGNSVTSISSNYTVQASDQGKLLVCENTITVTLLSATTASTNFMLMILNDGSGNVTVDGDGSETINGSTTITLDADEWVILVSDGTNWAGLVHKNPDTPTSGSFTATVLGTDGPATGTINWERTHNLVSMWAESTITGTSNNTSLIIDDIPSSLVPATAMVIPCGQIEDDGAQQHAAAAVFDTANDALQIRMLSGDRYVVGGFTASGSKGLATGWCITYLLN